MYKGRLGITQRVLVDYRKPFFEKLASLPGLELSVFAGDPAASEGLQTVNRLQNVSVWKSKNLYIPIPRTGCLYYQSGIQKWLEQFDPNILITDSNARIISNKKALSWMHRHRRKVLGWGLGQLPRSGPDWLCNLRRYFAERTIRNFDGIIAYSTKAKNDFVTAGMQEDKVFIAHNAIDNSESERFLQELERSTQSKEQWKKMFGLSNNIPTIIFVGRLLVQKNIDLLIKACSKIIPECQLLIVGNGPAMKDLQAFAKQHDKHIKFAGFQKGIELAKCFMISDLFVLPGWGGLAVNQAMSYGMPVLISYGDGTERDLVEEGKNGLFFQSNNLEDLEKSIRNLLSDSGRLISMGQASLEIIRNRINLDAMVNAFNKALIQTIKT